MECNMSFEEMLEYEKRDKEIKIRLSQKEWERLMHIKTRPQLAVWIRELALNPTADMFITPRGKSKSTVYKLSDEVERQLAIANNNLNQMAKAMNTLAMQNAIMPIESIDTIMQLDEIRGVLSAILTEVKAKSDS